MSTYSLTTEQGVERDDGRRPLELRDGDTVLATATPGASKSWLIEVAAAPGCEFRVFSERAAATALRALAAQGMRAVIA